MDGDGTGSESLGCRQPGSEAEQGNNTLFTVRRLVAPATGAFSVSSFTPTPRQAFIMEKCVFSSLCAFPQLCSTGGEGKVREAFAEVTRALCRGVAP